MIASVWIDTHCHLDAGEFDADRGAVVARARAAGDAQIVLPAVDTGNFERVRTLAHEHGTPLFVYDLQRIGEQARALRDAFARRNAPFTLRLAMKAQRDPAVLAYVRALGFVGIDACSPGEVRHALANNWQPDEISFTGTNVSDRDLDVLLGRGVHVNVDLLAQLERT